MRFGHTSPCAAFKSCSEAFSDLKLSPATAAHPGSLEWRLPSCSPEGSGMSSQMLVLVSNFFKWLQLSAAILGVMAVIHTETPPALWQPFWSRCCISFSLAPCLTRTLVSWTPSLRPASQPLQPHFHTLSCCSWPSLDLTPHTRQPLSGRGRAEWVCLLAPCWLCLLVNVGQS